MGRHFTKTELDEIAKGLATKAVRDTDFIETNQILPTDAMSVVQSGLNRKIKIKTFADLIAEMVEAGSAYVLTGSAVGSAVTITSGTFAEALAAHNGGKSVFLHYITDDESTGGADLVAMGIMFTSELIALATAAGSINFTVALFPDNTGFLSDEEFQTVAKMVTRLEDIHDPGAYPNVFAVNAGLAAKQDTIQTVNVSVDNNTGTPSGSAVVSGNTVSFQFNNLKGAAGATGPQGPQGPQGNTGSSVDYPYELVNNLTTDDATKGLSAAQGLVLEQKKVDSSTGKNLFKGASTQGYLTNAGVIASVTVSKVTDYIPIEPSTNYYASSWVNNAEQQIMTSAYGYTCFYDSNKQLISSESIKAATKSFITPSTAAYMRTTVYDAYNHDVQIEKGTSRTTYEPYNPIAGYLSSLPNESVSINAIASSAKDAEPIRTSVKLPLSGGIITYGERNYVPFGCKNIYDNVLEPGYFNPNGTISSSTAISHTVNYLPVKPETEYIATKADGTGIAAGTVQMVFYNKAKAVISAIPLGGVTTFTTPAWCYYIRTSVYNSYNNKVQIELGNTRTTYEPYNPIYKYLSPYEVAQTKSLLGASRVSASADTLEANTPLELTDFPKFSHARTGITAIAYFTNFTDMSVGNNREGGVAVKVDNTNVYFLVNPNSGTENAWETFAHGLTISTFLKVEIYVTKFGTVKVILFTNGGIKVINTTVNYSFNYVLMVKSSAVLEQVTISAVCGAFRCPVWALGDSYFGESVARVGYQMRELGFKDLYWSFLSGGHGYNLEPDFELALNFGTPKFVVWAIGQNDADSSTAISATWLQYTEKLLALCVEKGITPILCTIPNVPGSGALRNHSFKNAWVKASGYRYIDTEAAVGAQADGTWYPGMLSSDNIHPSVLGAQAIATQWMIDFPEVMEYGLLNEELTTE